MPKAKGRSYRPVGVVEVPCLRTVPSTSPFAPNRASAAPAFAQRPPRRSHHVTVPLVEPGRAATAVISCVPPPVSAIRAGSGALAAETTGAAETAGTAQINRREADATAPAARAVRMAQTVDGGSG